MMRVAPVALFTVLCSSLCLINADEGSTVVGPFVAKELNDENAMDEIAKHKVYTRTRVCTLTDNCLGLRRNVLQTRRQK